MSRGFIAVSAIMLALSTTIASTTFWFTYRDTAFITLIVVTIVAASLVAILGAVFRWNGLTMLLAVLVTYFVIGVPVAVPGMAIAGILPSPGGLQELARGAATSWKQLVTISAPVGDYGALLIPAFIVILVTVEVSLTLALRSRLGDLAVLGPIVVFVVGIIFGADTAAWPFPVAFGLTTSVLLWLTWNRWYRRRKSILLVPSREVMEGDRSVEKVADGGFVGARTLLSVGIILAIAGISSFAAMRFLPPTAERVVLRNTIAQPFDARNYPSPLSGFRSYEQSIMKDRTVLTISGLPTGTRIRVATLDSYDGVVYAVGQGSASSASGAFTRVPLSVDQADVNGSTAKITVTIGGYDAVWLPTIGKLKHIEFAGRNANELLDNFYFNRNSDTAAVVGGLSVGDSYTLTSVLPAQPSERELSRLEPGSAELPSITSVPEELASTLEGYVAGIVGSGKRLVAMLDGLRRDGYVSHGVGANEPASRSGHASDRITELLTAQRMIGDQEQYAVTAALMARQLGFPARVVFGFEPSRYHPAGSTVVTGGDVTAWIEVDTTQYGWVAIDPTPPTGPVPDAEPQDPTEVARPQSPVQPQTPEAESAETQPPPTTSQDDQDVENAMLALFLRVLTGFGWAMLVGVVLISPFLTIAIAKWRRRRLRRLAPTPLQRIAGAWEEFEDAVLDRGFEPGASPTRLEVAQAVGGTQPYVLAAVADRAVFSPGKPDAEQAAHLWTAVDDLRYTLDYNLTRWQRLKVLVSLRSLGGYSVSNLFTRGGTQR